VAFEDDRDERASVPDHRHRCYAESRPAPRALAHQQAYCLSSAFPVCPTFQDWARREAARARDAATAAAASTGGGAVVPAAASAGVSAASSGEMTRPDDEPAGANETPATDLASATPALAAGDPDDDLDADDSDDSDEFGVRRNPPRDWAAPPPWLASAERGGGRPDSGTPPFLSHRTSEPGQGLAGSSADWLAGGGSPAAAGLGAAAAGSAAAGSSADTTPADASPARSPASRASAAGLDAAARRGRVDSNDDSVAAYEELGSSDHDDDAPRRPARRARAYEQHLGGPDGPDWERPRRYEAYPTLKTRVGMPNLSRLGLMAGAIVIAAVALFFLPALLGLGGGGGGSTGASASPSAGAPSQSIAPTPVPAATPVLYVIKKNETLSKIATAHGITLDELLAANPQIKNPNKITEGQQITIPAPGDASPDQGVGSAAPSGP
jgi:hypothetical protein